MSYFALGSLVVGVGTTIWSADKQRKAANRAAGVDDATAAYNAKYDEAMAAQLDLDTIQNIRTQRHEDDVYLSREESSYASAGVLANTGSALDAQITNAGKLEQRIQQEWVNSQQKQAQYYSAASVGRLEGDARASADRMQGSIALINGGAKIASQAYGAYDSGAFSFGKSK